MYMRIFNQHIPGIIKAYNQNKNTLGKVEDKEKVSKNDGVELSSEARYYAIARQALQKLPEIDEAKVAELKQAVKSGTYRVNHEEVAEKILEENIFDKLV
jgi:negative regulator of flagellin synthesis FlgM